MRIAEAFLAATPKAYYVRGNFLRIQSGVADIDIDFYLGGQLLPENLRGASAAWWAYPERGFDQIVVTSSGAQAVEIDVYSGRVGSDAVGGTVSLTSFPSGAHAPAAKAVTNADVQILAANAARKYLLIQNQDAALPLFVRCDGVAATATAACISIPAGGVWEPPYVPTGEVRGIRGGASAGNNVHVIEG